MQGVDIIFYVMILIMSVVVHEVSHGYVANYLGDKTAKLAGRLTLNPLKHLDFVGSFLVPLLLVISKVGIVFGWAKPVPFNPYNLRDQKWGIAMVAAAGPLSNIGIAIVFGILMRLAPTLGFASEQFFFIASAIVLINIILAVFNLIPIPPLDGSKVLFSLLPYRYRNIEVFLSRYGIFILLFFIFFLWQFIFPVIFGLYELFTGTIFMF